MSRVPRLLYLVTEDWYFVSHRLPMARAARAAGYEVHVAARVDRHADVIAREGFVLHALPWAREARSPLAIVRETLAVRALYRKLAPDLVHHVALKPTVLGSLAAFGLAIPRVNALAGLGWSFLATSLRARLMRVALTGVLRVLLDRPDAVTLVQNPDDEAAIAGLGVARERIERVPGSGVDVAALVPSPEPDGPFTIAFVGRMLEDKGVRPLVEAQRLLRARGVEVRLLLAGEPDPANPASIAPAELDAWAREPGIVRLGHVADIRDVWRQAYVAVLPSRREGLPKSLLEAAACGRPMVATDVPGCREVAIAGANALLVPVDDAPALAAAIGTYAADPALRARHGAESRRLAETRFADHLIGDAVVALYDRLLARTEVRDVADA